MATVSSRRPPRGDINVLVYSRGPERYIWLFRDDQLPDVQRSLGRMAMNRDLPFTWLDAAKCAASARKQLETNRCDSF